MKRALAGVLLALPLLSGGLAAGQAAVKPFGLPVADPPGPGSWLFGQPYGNTVGAFLQGRNWYEAGQRLHFGVDISMPCGTELVAIGDGTVLFVDDLGFGSGPHNLLIRHDAEGVISLYGHLLERPALNPGDSVRKGQPVALSGDPDVTCDSRQHLHLELRSLDYFVTYNPLDYMEANWHALAMAGPFRFPLFQQNLDDARRWMDLHDQPDVAFGGPPLNDYAATWPDLRNGEPPANPPLDRVLPAPGDYTAQPTATIGCCAGAWWDPADPLALLAIDGAAGQRAAVLRWSEANQLWMGPVSEAPPAYRSPDGSHTVTMSDGTAVITRLADGVSWTVDTHGRWPALSPDNQQLLWLRPAENGTDDPPIETWIANADGSNARAVASATGAYAYWLDADRLLIGRRELVTTTLGVYHTRTSEAYVLGSWNWLRGLSIGPGGKRLLFYTVWEDAHGLYTLETAASAQAQRLPWFGGWRWRDADSVYLAPLDAAATTTALLVANVATGEAVPLTVEAPVMIGNGDWSVSADGQRLALFNALDGRTWIVRPSGEVQP